jgi:drug/metabolite transporter (DMT)-like permease
MIHVYLCLMSWLTYAFIGVLAYSMYYMLSRVFLKEKNSNAVVYAILFNLVCVVILTIVALARGFDLLDIKKYALNLVLMGVLYAAAQIFIFKASKTIEASELIIISSTRVLWTIAAALLFLGESFNIQKIAGTALVIFAVVLVSYKKKQVKLSIGYWFAVAAGFCLGIGFVNDAYILKNADVFSYGVLVFALPLVLTMAVYAKSLPKFTKEVSFKLVGKNILLGLFYAVGMIASYSAYQHGGSASQIVPIGQSVVIVTVILAALFLGERDHLFKKTIAAVLVSVGVLLIK